MKRVVITGAGTINALGHNVPQTLEAMREGRCGIGPLDFRDVDRLAIKIGGQVRDFNADLNSTANKCPFMIALPSSRCWLRKKRLANLA